MPHLGSTNFERPQNLYSEPGLYSLQASSIATLSDVVATPAAWLIDGTKNIAVKIKLGRPSVNLGRPMMIQNQTLEIDLG